MSNAHYIVLLVKKTLFILAGVSPSANVNACELGCIIGSSVGVVIGVGGIVMIVFFVKRRKKTRSEEQNNVGKHPE